MKAVVIGGGAAGFFGAISIARHNPDAEIILLEKTNKLLSKVKVSGGGRCNVTNSESNISTLLRNYPRGAKELRTVFGLFSTNDTIRFFEDRGVALKSENDGRVFPVADLSQVIIDCLVNEARVLGVKILTDSHVKTIRKEKDQFELTIKGGAKIICDKVLIAAGGFQNPESYTWLQAIGHSIVRPVPSLFTFNIPDFRLNGLQGLSVGNVSVRINGTRQSQDGAILITHWGLSGPSVIKLSAWLARQLYELNYSFGVVVNWLPQYNEETFREYLANLKKESSKKVFSSAALFNLPRRLWERFVALAQIDPDVRWHDLSKKQMNVLTQEIINGTYVVNGKTTFKEEFVTAGGVNLKEIDMHTMESKVESGLYFAGEVLDIDGVTGGFNFQAAWSTGFIAGKHIAFSLYRK